MCGLFGFLQYGKTPLSNLSALTQALAEESAVRGTDAAGIAWNSRNKLNIIKAGKPAYQMHFRHSDTVTALIGHTRHSTQGSEKHNYNNHPFFGTTKTGKFALAHNGVLFNEADLRKKYHLPDTKIQTDSFIAVQLLEYREKLDFGSLKFMAEQLSGSFSFSVLDDRDNLYLIRGESPLSVLHFPEQKIYVYASTEEILWKAIICSPLFSVLKKQSHAEISLKEGEILRIDSKGVIARSTFTYTQYTGFVHWWNCGVPSSNTEYVEALKGISGCCGYSPDIVDELLTEGFTPEEIEDYLYCGNFETQEV